MILLKHIHKGHAKNVPYFVAQSTDIDVSDLNYKKGTKKKTLLINPFAPKNNIKVKGKGKGHFYLTSVVPSVPMRPLSMEADGADLC